jgi:hypothetical protein
MFRRKLFVLDYQRNEGIMKYKPCCDRRCLKHGCTTREQGGCSCLCGLFDHLHSLKRVQEGYIIKVGVGEIYYPNLDMAREMADRLPEKDKSENQKYLESIPTRMKEIEDRIKEYENPVC